MDFLPVITGQDLFVVGFLMFLEGVLSIDNAIVMALMVRHLPENQQKKALGYGLWGAVIFRMAALAITKHLMQWRWVKFVGGGYLLFIGLKHFIKPEEDENNPDKPKKHHSFWMTVLLVELLDIAFAVDSILAAVAVSPKFWVIFVGSFMGVLVIRFAATLFLKLLKIFPSFTDAAFILITIIGTKVVIDGFHFEGVHFESPSSPAFWIFWGLMLAGLAYGFRKKKPETA